MGSLGDRLGKFDDETVIYRAEDPEQKVHWPRLALTYAVGSILGGLIMAGATRLLGDAGIVVALALIIAFLVTYVIWRRRRNKRLTGSATTWPSS